MHHKAEQDSSMYMILLLAHLASLYDKELLRGLIWNQDTYSCAYDSLFTIIKCLYDQSNAQQKLQLKQTNIFLHALCEQIDNVNNNSCTFEEGRDLVRQLLHEAQPDEFTIRGSTGTWVEGQQVAETFSE